MKLPDSTVRAARRAARIALFGGGTAFIAPFYASHTTLAGVLGRRPQVHDRWVTHWARGMLRVMGVRVDAVHHAPIPAGPKLLFANHRSALDILVMQSLGGGHMVSRADLARWPLVGPIARLAGTVFLERTSSSSRAQVLRGIEAALREGKTIALFPEGGTFAGDTVRRFHGAAFLAAGRAGVPVVPVGLAYAHASQASFLDESFLQHVGRVAATPRIAVAATVGEARTAPADRQQLATFATQMQDTVQELVDTSRARVPD